MQDRQKDVCQIDWLTPGAVGVYVKPDKFLGYFLTARSASAGPCGIQEVSMKATSMVQINTVLNFTVRHGDHAESVQQSPLILRNGTVRVLWLTSNYSKHPSFTIRRQRLAMVHANDNTASTRNFCRVVGGAKPSRVPAPTTDC